MIANSADKATKMSKPPSTFAFLDLPAELRNEIYKHVFSGWIIPFYQETQLSLLSFSRPYQAELLFCDIKRWNNRPVSCQCRKANSSDHSIPFTTLTALSRTCRQVYEETRLLPFRYCRYYVSLDELKTWLLWLTRMDGAMFKIVWEALTEAQRAVLLSERDTMGLEHRVRREWS
ncbi:hypothetical protein E8E13_005805 [Curvularia kusanoi]|uniref:DUF7730 domain-containing protein n=1 Tax=Curvularia kusanoi TaxID=90978 RepID=A0A9P4W608_CURKU|nr:hypothetical protein E8E13_005805 [Curvularia kusanoi]